jgi:hypothetical protein
MRPSGPLCRRLARPFLRRRGGTHHIQTGPVSGRRERTPICRVFSVVKTALRIVNAARGARRRAGNLSPYRECLARQASRAAIALPARRSAPLWPLRSAPDRRSAEAASTPGCPRLRIQAVRVNVPSRIPVHVDSTQLIRVSRRRGGASSRARPRLCTSTRPAAADAQGRCRAARARSTAIALRPSPRC